MSPSDENLLLAKNCKTRTTGKESNVSSRNIFIHPDALLNVVQFLTIQDRTNCKLVSAIWIRIIESMKKTVESFRFDFRFRSSVLDFSFSEVKIEKLIFLL